MRYLVWFLRLVVFVVVLMFALNNMQAVTVRFFQDHVVSDIPLIIVMLATFVLGVVFGFLMAFPGIMRRRREAARLRRDVQRLEEQARNAKVPAQSTPLETTAPLSPL
jgi:uncharacterized integral membrane protein